MHAHDTSPARSAVDADRLMAFLKDRNSYPHSPPSVTIVQTHAAVVALAPPFVYKIKKPLDLGFLDFSTLEKRRFYTGREIELNRRLCPDTYLGVVPIVLRDNQLAFGSETRMDGTVEYAVKMKQLDGRFFLDRLLRERKVSPADIDRIVSALVPFYARQDPSGDVTRTGRPEHLEQVVMDNLSGAERFVDQAVKRSTLNALRHFNIRFLEERSSLLQSRIERRRILDCHGDLHREHIHLGPDRVRIFDCIEFNDTLRYVDVAADVAFLAMDLDYVKRNDLSRYLVDRMAQELDDPGMLELMDFYKCYRAAVRGKVKSLQSVDRTVRKDRPDAIRRHAVRYYQLALNYAVAGAEPLIVVVMGPVASGKTTVSSALADALGWRVISSDRLRKTLAGVPIMQRPDRASRNTLYSEAMTKRTYAKLTQRARSAAKKGNNIILDATFGRRQHREQLREAMHRSGAEVTFVELCTPTTTVKARLRKREKQSDIISDARLEDFETLFGRYEAPTASSEPGVLRFDGKRPTDSIVEDVLTGLMDRRASKPQFGTSSFP